MEQLELFEKLTPAECWDIESDRRALDELFHSARTYRTGEEYMKLVRFVAKFRMYSPFNAVLVQMQMPGATFVAPSHRWEREYGRRVKPGTRPIVILQPMSPVMFVYDLSDTEPLPVALHVPPEILNPFQASGTEVAFRLKTTIENAKRDGIRVTEQDAGTGSAGSIETARPGLFFEIQRHRKKNVEIVRVPITFELLLNAKHPKATQYATLIHELGHLYCGHLGTPNPNWWPDRRGLDHKTVEFEAESVSYLVCNRSGIDTPAEKYLSGFFNSDPEVPTISLDCVLKSAGLIEQMGKSKLPLRSEE